MRVQRQPVRLVQEAQRTQVVDAEDMVGVGVCIEHGIQVANVLANRLLAEIRRRIDENGMSVVFHQHRRPGAAVMRVA